MHEDENSGFTGPRHFLRERLLVEVDERQEDLDRGHPTFGKLSDVRKRRRRGRVQNGVTVLRLSDGEGCARLLRADEAKGALLLERLGRSLHDIAPPIEQRHEILCAAAARIWRPALGCGLPTGAEKGKWLIDFITATWEELGRPCSEYAIDYALACA